MVIMAQLSLGSVYIQYLKCFTYRMAATLCAAVTFTMRNPGADWQTILMIHMMKGMMLYLVLDLCVGYVFAEIIHIMFAF
jgi:hypothetical protein